MGRDAEAFGIRRGEVAIDGVVIIHCCIHVNIRICLSSSYLYLIYHIPDMMVYTAAKIAVKALESKLNSQFIDRR